MSNKYNRKQQPSKKKKYFQKMNPAIENICSQCNGIVNLKKPWEHTCPIKGPIISK